MSISLNAHLNQQNAPSALTETLSIIAQTCANIAGIIPQSALANTLGAAESVNIQGEQQKQLDVIANEQFKNNLLKCAHVRLLASEEEDTLVEGNQSGAYSIAFDPLDGSSNIDVNVSVGSIFSVLPVTEATESALLQPASKQIAAGYAIYGPTTMLVLSIGQGTHLYTLDNQQQCFVLTQPNLSIPVDTKEFAVNMSNHRFWQTGMRNYIDACLQGETGPLNKNYNMRWIASMVADVHRILIRGGLFTYPWDSRDPTKPGKLRYLYEVAPMNFLIEQAHGKCSTGIQPVGTHQPTHLHERVPVILGSANEVDACLSFLKD